MTRRPLALVFLALLVSSALPLLGPGAPAEAQTSTAPWYGPGDKNAPTDGFAFRVPITITNPSDDKLKGHVASVELDFGKLAVEAGWTNQTVSGEARARGFTLDPASIRVVEYDRGFRAFKEGNGKPTAHIFTPSQFYTTMRGRDFDPATNPVGTLTWALEGDIPAKQSRLFMVYFSPLEYGLHQPHAFTELERANVESAFWHGPAHVMYGYENGADGRENMVDVVGIYDKTEVTFYVYKFSAFVRHEPESKAFKNPVHVNSTAGGPTQYARYLLPSNTLFKVVSNKPVVVAGSGHRLVPTDTSLPPTYGAGAPIPASDGRLRGREFNFPYYSNSILVIGGQEAGTSTVSFGVFSPQGDNCGAGGQVVVSSGSPRTTINFPQCNVAPQGAGGTFVNVNVNGPPVMLMYAGGGALPLTQVPSRYGAPVGTDAYGLLDNNGQVAAFAWEPAAVRVFNPSNPNVQLFPKGPFAETAPQYVEPGLKAPLVAPADRDFPTKPPSPVRAWSSGEPSFVPPSGQGRIQAFFGDATQKVGYYAGPGGTRTVALGPATVIAFFDETRVKVTELRPAGLVNFSRNLARDGTLALAPASATSTGKYLVESTKPVVVVSTERVNTYGRFVIGRLEPLPTVQGTPEFRGRLVDIDSPEREGRQLFKTTGPEQPVTFKLRVFNLGRWQAGENLPDTITIKCDAQPAEYEVSGGCGKQFTLASRSASAFDVTVTPKGISPRDPIKNPGQITVTAVSSASNVTARIKLIVRVEVTYGVGVWLDREGGPKIVDPPTSLDPGEAVNPPYAVVFKNLGSVRDTFDLRVAPEPSPGWFVDLQRAGRPVKTISLDPNEVTQLQLVVRAPAGKEATSTYNLVEVSAKSQSSPLQADKVTVATRIRPDINFKLALDERTKLARPGETARFNVTVTNAGNAIFSVALTQESPPPFGWNATLPFSAIDLPPGKRANLTLLVTPPADALAGELASIDLRGESTVDGTTSAPEFVTASVLVRQIHNITFPEPFGLQVGPGETLNYTLMLTNNGNGHERVELDRFSAKPAWPLRGAATDVVEILRGETGEFPIRIDVPDRTPAGLYNYTFTVRLSREDRMNVSIPLTVAPLRKVALSVPVPIEAPPGQPYRFPVDLRATGNLRDDYALRAELPPGWEASFEPANLTLAPGDVARATLVLNASREASDARYPVRLVAVPKGSPDVVSRFATTVLVARPELRLGEVQVAGAAREGELMVVSVPVANRGAIEARDVRIALRVNGEDVDLVTIERIPASTEKLATLKWTVDRSVKTMNVLLNPGGDVADATTEDKARDVPYKRGLPAPGLAIALGTLALAAFAARASGTQEENRRRR